MQSRKVARFSAAALASATLLAACGGQSDEQQIRSVVNDFTVHVGQSNSTAACRLTTGQLQPLCGKGGVTDALQTAGSPLSSFTSLTISKVVVSGSSATVAFNGSGEVMTLSKQNGKWLIASA